jgi:hypothetical protein
MRKVTEAFALTPSTASRGHPDAETTRFAKKSPTPLPESRASVSCLSRAKQAWIADD